MFAKVAMNPEELKQARINLKKHVRQEILTRCAENGITIKLDTDVLVKLLDEAALSKKSVSWLINSCLIEMYEVDENR